MRNASIVASGIVLSATLFTSCTCHKEISPPPESTTFQAPKSGFHAAAPKLTPQARLDTAQEKPSPQPSPAAVAEVQPTPPADVPPDFPQDMPIFKDAKLAQVQDLANDAHNVIFRTEASITDVYSFYEDRMRKNGWQVTQQVQRSTHAFISFKKGDMIANLTITEDVQNPGKHVIAIMYEQQKPLEFEEF